MRLSVRLRGRNLRWVETNSTLGWRPFRQLRYSKGVLQGTSEGKVQPHHRVWPQGPERKTKPTEGSEVASDVNPY